MCIRDRVELGLITGVLSSAIGLLFAYVDVYVKLKYKWIEKLFNIVDVYKRQGANSV